MLMFAALPVVKASQQWSLPLPNHYNIAFSYYYFTIFFMLLYIPCESTDSNTPCTPPIITLTHTHTHTLSVFPQLYGHMIKQRRKVIGGKPKEE